MTEFPSEDIINGTIDEILNTPEFTRPGNKLLEFIQEKLIEFIGMLLESASEATAAPIIVLIIVALIAVLCAVFFVLRARRARKLKNVELSQSGGISKVAELLRAAESFAERGEFDKAVILMFISHLKSLETHGFITIEKSKTNIQYERELAQNGYDRVPQFKEFKDLFNTVRYGYRHAVKEDFDVWHAYCVASPSKEDAA